MGTAVLIACEVFRVMATVIDCPRIFWDSSRYFKKGSMYRGPLCKSADAVRRVFVVMLRFWLCCESGSVDPELSTYYFNAVFGPEVVLLSKVCTTLHIQQFILSMTIVFLKEGA